MPVAIIGLVIKLLPTILSIIEKVIAAAHDRRMIQAGQAEAINEANQRLSVTLAKARVAMREAEAAQATHPDDDAGFDQSFKRKD